MHTNTQHTSEILAGRCHRSGVHRWTLGPAPASLCCRADTGSVSLASPGTCNQTRAWLQVLSLLSGLRLQVKGTNVLSIPPQTGLSSCAAVKPMRGSYHVPSAADGTGSAASSSRSAQLSDGNKGWTVRDRLEKRFSLRRVCVGRQSCYSCADDSSGDAELTH